MPCTWLYVLTSNDGDYVYVGMTHRLITRLNEHMEGKGAVATSRRIYNTVQCVYKIDTVEQHNHALENELTLKIMRSRGGAWWKVRGGKWCGMTKRPMPPELRAIQGFPEMCLCHYPVDVMVAKNGRKFATCACKNTDWLRGKVNVGYEIAGSTCNYFRWTDGND